MVLVDVTWSEWQPGRDRARYERIVRTLLEAPAEELGEAGPVHVHQCYEEDRGDASWVVPAAPYELPPGDVCRKPGEWLAGADGLKRVLAELDREEANARESGRALLYEVHDWRKLFRTRVFMSAERFRALAGFGGRLGYWVLIDMRFQWIAQGSVLWHTSFTAWSDQPWSVHHRSRQAVVRDPQGLSADGAAHLMEEYETSRRAFREIIGAPDRSALRVFGRYYQPPSFVVAVPVVPPPRGDGQAADVPSQLDILPDVSRRILGTRHYQLLPFAPLKSGVDVYRRFLPDRDRDLPRYLLIPDTRASARTAREADQQELRALQEEATANCITVLTDLEAYAASQLDGIDSRMRTRENHLRIYQGVAEQAGTLWDALARLLPDARGERLELVHRSIEMIHQTLLQGVAELDQLVRSINGALSHIETTADEISDRFDRELSQPARPQDAALRESLRGGYIDRLRRYVGEASRTAIRVTDSYRMLLDTIGLAFDERRVREGDRMQKASMWLALAFGILGLSGVAQATLPLPAIRGILVWFVQIVLWVVTAAATGAILYQLNKLRGAGRVASRAFEGRYKVVRQFLAGVSTDRLDAFRREQQQPAVGPAQRAARWQTLDQELSAKFIQAWTVAGDAEAAIEPGSYGAAALRTRVEAWTLRTLLLTERPRDFAPYSLPYLTCLYRVCAAQELTDWRTPDETASVDSAVGAEELHRVLTEAQYEWFLTREAGLLGQAPATILGTLRASGALNGG